MISTSEVQVNVVVDADKAAVAAEGLEESFRGGVL